MCDKTKAYQGRSQVCVTLFPRPPGFSTLAVAQVLWVYWGITDIIYFIYVHLEFSLLPPSIIILVPNE
jgi:hypothetical protein